MLRKIPANLLVRTNKMTHMGDIGLLRVNLFDHLQRLFK